MDLNLFENRKTEDNFINKFIEELKNALENTISQKQNRKEESNVMDEYNRYERRKIFLANKSKNGNGIGMYLYGFSLKPQNQRNSHHTETRHHQPSGISL